MSNAFHNQSTNTLADDYGNLKAQADAINARLKDIKAELIKRSVTQAAGDRFAVTVSEQSSVRLDTKGLRAALGDDICKDFENVSFSTVVRVKAVASVAEAT